jgi:Fe-S cluster assembly protein SufD
MIDLKERIHSLIENFTLLETLLDALGPASWQSKRKPALDRFELRGIPTHKDEEWRFTPLNLLRETAFKAAYGATVSRGEFEGTPVGKVDAATIAFINGQEAPELAVPRNLPNGVFVGTIAQALEDIPEVVERWLGKVATLEGKLGSTNDERFVDLNTAYLSEGAVVYVPRNVVVEDPIHIAYISKGEHGPFAAFPRILVVAEENSQVKLLESYTGLEGTYFNCIVTEVVLGNHAIVEHDKFQWESLEAVHIANLAVHQEGQSTYTSNNIGFGAAVGRNDLNVWIEGEHAETWLNGAYVATGTQIADNHTRIDHAKPNCNSFEVYKGVMTDRGQGIFNGKIFVYEDAQKTDAKQTNQAILLSPTASIETKPQLEIFADDVKCTHGATVGQIKEDAKFYLRSRGIPEKGAEAILVYAFAAEVIEKIALDEVRVALEKVLFEKLNS